MGFKDKMLKPDASAGLTVETKCPLVSSAQYLCYSFPVRTRQRDEFLCVPHGHSELISGQKILCVTKHELLSDPSIVCACSPARFQSSDRGSRTCNAQGITWALNRKLFTTHRFQYLKMRTGELLTYYHNYFYKYWRTVYCQNLNKFAYMFFFFPFPESFPVLVPKSFHLKIID